MSHDSTVEEVRSRLDIVQLISEYLKLQKAGTRFRAPCPFHNEKDPSFYVSPDRQRWHCFGCNEDGDAFEFVMRMEGMDFPEALRHLAQKVGVQLPEYRPDPDRQAKADGRERLHEANRQAAEFWHQILLRHANAEPARKYVEKRRLNDNTVDRFLIGYSPDSWDVTVNFLRRKGFSDRELIESGLANRNELRNSIFDRFRNRLMFPIRDASGRHVGFSGRIMPGPEGRDPEGEAKYINTSQTEIYNKGDVLFAFDFAKQGIRKSGFAVVVEGNMDAVASHQAGVTNVVASSGTAFTDSQLRLLRKLCDRLVLSFDGDEAGEKAARRSIELAVSHGFEVRVLRLPPEAGKDPDDCIRRDPGMWNRAIAEAVPFMEWHVDLARERTDFRDPYAKARAMEGLKSEVVRLPSAVERAHWIRVLSEMFETLESSLVEEIGRMGPAARPLGRQSASPAGTAAPGPAPSGPSVRRDRHGTVSEYLIGLVLAWPELSETVVGRVLPELFEDSLAPLYTALVMHYNELRIGGQDSDSVRPAAFRPGDDQTGQRLAFLELQAEREFGGLTAEQRAAVTDRLVAEIKRLHTDRLRRHLNAEMAKAERENDSVRVAEILRQLDELTF
ncbi:DNA primase [Candidatus Uhrbacteria bacterium]|nr:DNA primase [Candidatus Uhrbacteria bacterium]